MLDRHQSLIEAGRTVLIKFPIQQRMAPGGTITGSGEPYLPSQQKSSYSGYDAEDEEPEPIR